MILGLPVRAQQGSVYTHRILCDDAVVDFIELFGVHPVHVELRGKIIRHEKQAGNYKWR